MTPLLVILFPLLVAVLLAHRGLARTLVPWLLPVAALPALLYAWWGDPVRGFDVPWLLVGARVGPESSGMAFLFLTAFLWFVAGWYARGYLGEDAGVRRYCFFHLLTLTGNVGLVLAEDVPSFYACFALMTFAAYGLVVHQGTPAARRAARIYLAMAVIGEALLLAGLLLAVKEAESLLIREMAEAVARSESRDTIVLLTFFGFGVKAGALPVHFWLPLAHPVAPTPASAVLSGAMIKAGLLGWLHFLPLGQGDFPGWSGAIVALGIGAAFYAVVCGFPQRDPKTILAYSSVSQMGLMTVGVGAGLANAEVWPAALVAVTVFALNHALAKSALFLGVGVSAAYRKNDTRKRVAVLAGLMLPAFAIAGAPLLAGAIAKYALKQVTEDVPGWREPWLGVLLTLSAVGTALLLGRFIFQVWEEMRREEPHAGGAGLWVPWAVAVMGAGGGVFFAIAHYAIEVRAAPLTLASFWDGAWPMLVGAGLAVALQWRRGWRREGAIPPGDAVVLVERLGRLLLRLRRRMPPAERWAVDLSLLVERVTSSRRVHDFLNVVEIRMKRWETTGAVLLLLLLALWWSLA